MKISKIIIIDSINKKFKLKNILKEGIILFFNKCNMNHMFYKCRELKKINLSNFNIENVKNISSIFEECSSLKEINLSNFNAKKVVIELLNYIIPSYSTKSSQQQLMSCQKFKNNHSQLKNFHFEIFPFGKIKISIFIFYNRR